MKTYTRHCNYNCDCVCW